MYQFSDGGKTEAGFTERNDCAVRAYGIFKNIPYADAHAIFSKLGRKDRKGTNNRLIFELLGEGAKRTDAATLNQLRRKHPTGRIYALIRGHAFAVIDGVVYDSWKVGDKVRIRAYWYESEVGTVPNVKQANTNKPARGATIPNKKQQVLALYNKYNGLGTNHWIAKQIAIEMGITVANATYYITRVFNA